MSTIKSSDENCLKMQLNLLRLHTNNIVDYKNENSIVAINHFSKTYYSIQLINNYNGSTPIEVAHIYFNWLSSVTGKLIKTKFQNQTYKLCFFLFKKPLLELKLVENDADHVIFQVSGGILAKKSQQGTFSFLRSTENNVLIALKQFSPRLPWFLYKLTQAPVHEVVMKQFQKKMRLTKSC